VKNDHRPSVAAAGTLLLAAAVGVVVLSGGGGNPAPTPPPPACFDRWNSNQNALVFGRHNYLGHSYTSAQVRLLDMSGEVPRMGEGRCAVVFPSPTLDPEPAAAAEIYIHDRWTPLARLPRVPDVRLSELQVDAQSAANVQLRPDGTLAP
jgi:hypothetical protein